MSYEIASPLSHLVLERIKRECEFDLQRGDSLHRRLYRVGTYRDFIADPDMGGDESRPVIDRGRSDFPERAFSVDVLRRKARE